MQKESTSREKASKLLKRHIVEFKNHVAREKDLFAILLKGHLLIEYYLDHLILLLINKNPSKKSFFDKIAELEKTKCFPDQVISSLYKLNDVRNNLAHGLDYNLTPSEIDSIGYTLGKEYVIKKLDLEVDATDAQQQLLIWVFEKIALQVYIPIFEQILDTIKIKLNNWQCQVPQTPRRLLINKLIQINDSF